MEDNKTTETNPEERRCTGSECSTLLTELSEAIKCHEQQIADIKENTLKPIEAALSNAKQAFAEEKCFCKVGDKIQKKDGDPMVVSRIFYARRGFELRAFKIKSNGEPYKNDSPLWEWKDDWSDYIVLSS